MTFATTVIRLQRELGVGPFRRRRGCRITNDQIEAVRVLSECRRTRAEICALTGMAPSTVSQIVHRKGRFQ